MGIDELIDMSNIGLWTFDEMARVGYSVIDFIDRDQINVLEKSGNYEGFQNAFWDAMDDKIKQLKINPFKIQANMPYAGINEYGPCDDLLCHADASYVVNCVAVFVLEELENQGRLYFSENREGQNKKNVKSHAGSLILFPACGFNYNGNEFNLTPLHGVDKGENYRKTLVCSQIDVYQS